MSTKQYAICDREAWDKFRDHFCPYNGSHYIELANGRLLVLGFFHKEENALEFENRPGIDVLPDAFETTGILKQHHAEQLLELLPPDADTSNISMLAIARGAAQRHRLMKLRTWL